ncbi:MAG: Uma2 family endonuclease [Candidatus Eremiobacteraeota bacterium]|nr:Uma2 family endonuclease [Candidatus Eremiobacteraeota bacterium]MBC5803866.1 Uma2 family endonuclease [Candidatus Eremiobacteraeota bacterium]MBC5822976.1 Uma2 family endonuclease [Candidatus Eremiobacteraeota bacterium]
MQAKTEATPSDRDLRLLAHDALTDDDALMLFGERIDMQVERIGGKLVVSPPMGFDGGVRENDLAYLITTWARSHGYVTTSPSANYRLPDGDAPAPDVGLVRQDRVDSMSERERKKIPSLVPDIVVELLSESQRTPSAVSIERAKCERWFKAGAHYVVLIDPFSRKTTVWGEAPVDFPDLISVFGPPPT